MHKLNLMLSVLLFTSGITFASELPSLDIGKTLFESTELGDKGRSCASCHANGKGLSEIGDFNDEELKDIINACLRDAVGAKMISTDSQEMNALVNYVRMFQKQ